jgi:hypothetical protein
MMLCKFENSILPSRNIFYRKDLDEAGVTIDKDRGTVGSMLAASGVHPKTAQQLMRHSDINLTNYSANQLAAKIEKSARSTAPEKFKSAPPQ